MRRPLILVISGVFALVAVAACLWFFRPNSANSQPQRAKAAASNPAPASASSAFPSNTPPPSPATPTAQQPHPVNPFAFLNQAKVLATRETPVDPQGNFSRVSVMQTDMKYPYVLVEDSLMMDPATKAEILRGRQAMVADQVIVKLMPGATQQDLDLINQKYAAKVIDTLSPYTYVVQLSAPDLDSVSNAIAAYTQETNHVAYAEPNFLVESLSTIPNDPSFSALWGMNNTGQNGGTADADIDAPEAWDLTKGSNTIIVGIIDTGVDYGHPDLAANIWTNTGEVGGNGIDDDGNGYIDDVRGWDFYNNDNNPADDHFHGTHCAGTIGGIGNNSQGVAGVCWQVSIMPLKFLSNTGSGFTSDAIKAVSYATRMHARLTSNSWGGGGFSQALKDAIDAAGAQQILFVAAAGNDGSNIDTTPSYPASFTSANLISVAATDSRDQLAGFSNFGATGVDVGAPGVGIYSTVPRVQTSAMSSSGIPANYASLNGTSMATPHVAGAMALLLSRSPNLTAAQAKSKLLTTTDATSALNGKVVSNGRLNVYRMLNSVVVNGSPQVNAGPDRSVNMPASVSIDATVTDDSLPNPPGATTTSWTKVSGPGVVTFGNASSVDTTASFSATGSYVIRLTANDGALSASDDVTVTVFGVNTAPVVDAGVDQSGGSPLSVDGTVSDDGQPIPQNLVTTWSKVSGPGTVTFGSAASVDTPVTFSAVGVYVLRLTASDGALTTTDDVQLTITALNAAPTISAGPDQAVGPTGSVYLDGTASDDGLPAQPGSLSFNWSVRVAPGGVSFQNPNALDTTASFSTPGSYLLRLTVSDGVLSSFDDIGIIVNAPSKTQPANSPPSAGAGPDQTVKLPAAAVLDGSMQDDGRPLSPGTLSANWTKLSGPGSVGFANANTPDTTATFSAPGVYQLRFTASDGEASTSDTIQVTINPAGNATPIARADSAVTDNGAAVLIPVLANDEDTDAWPNALSIQSAGTAANGTVAIVSGQIRYTPTGAFAGSDSFTYTITDGALTASATVSVTVRPPNTAPSVDAGPDLAVTLPALASLDGTVSDDGLPTQPGSLVASWTMTSGPGSVTFGNTAAVDTTARFSVAGSYVLRLSVTDGALSSSDTLTVTVTAPPNQPPTATNDSASTNEEVSVLISVLANDSDPDNGPNPLAISSVGSAGHGSVAISGSQIRYTPTPGFFGIDSFTYTVSDGSASASASVQVTVRNTALAQDLTSANLQGVRLGTATGSSRILAGGIWEITASGTGFAATDSVYFEQQARSDAFEATVRIQSVSGGPAPQAGLMLREGIGASAKFISVSAGGATAYRSDWRLATAGPLASAVPVSPYSYPNAWVGIVRHGSRVTLYTSSDGQTWVQDRVVQLSGLSSSVNIGIFVSSGASGVNTRALLSNFSIQPLVEPAIAAGSSHSLAIKDDGTAWSWGLNSTGQLGDGSASTRGTPGAVSGLSDTLALAGGGAHTLALKTNGTVMAWGNNSHGQVGDGTTSQRNSPANINFSGVTAIAAGDSHSMALKNNGTVWVWGEDAQGQLGDGPAPPPPPPSKYGPPPGPPSTEKWAPCLVPGLSGIIAIAAGNSHSLALRNDGTVWAWGSNAFGQLGIGGNGMRESPAQVSGLSGVIAIAAGKNHSLAITSDGSVWAWGDNSSGQLGDGTNTPRTLPVLVTGLAGAKAISAGGAHSLALKQDGTVSSWGDNAQGQLGDGTTTPRNQPVTMTGVAQAVAIAAGGQHSIILLEDGSVFSTGNNAQGQLGIPGAAVRLTPSAIPGFSLL